MSQARFSVRTAVAEGFGFWRGNVLKAAGPLLIVSGLALKTTVAPVQSAAGAMGLNLLALLAFVAAQGALYRIALAPAGAESPDRNGPFGLQWRWLESRLLALTLLTVLLLFIVGVVVTFLLAVVLLGFVGGEVAVNAASPDALMASLSPTGQAVFNIGLLLCFVGVLVLVMRLTMAAPATAAEGRIRMLSTLGLTRGSVLRLLAAVILVNLPVFALQGLALAWTSLTHAPATNHWPEGLAAALSPFFYLPISVGMTSYVYQRLREGADQ